MISYKKTHRKSSAFQLTVVASFLHFSHSNGRGWLICHCFPSRLARPQESPSSDSCLIVINFVFIPGLAGFRLHRTVSSPAALAAFCVGLRRFSFLWNLFSRPTRPTVSPAVGSSSGGPLVCVILMIFRAFGCGSLGHHEVYRVQTVIRSCVCFSSRKM